MLLREFLKERKDAKRLAVALEAAMVPHAVVERNLATVAEGWVAEIVSRANRLDHGEVRKVLNSGVAHVVLGYLTCDAGRNLGNL